jgi:hypothetical protein
LKDTVFIQQGQCDHEVMGPLAPVKGVPPSPGRVCEVRRAAIVSFTPWYVKKALNQLDRKLSSRVSVKPCPQVVRHNSYIKTESLNYPAALGARCFRLDGTLVANQTRIRFAGKTIVPDHGSNGAFGQSGDVTTGRC